MENLGLNEYTQVEKALEWKEYTSKNTQSMTRLSSIEGAYSDNDWKQVSEQKCERVGECPVHDCANLASKIVGSTSILA